MKTFQRLLLLGSLLFAHGANAKATHTTPLGPYAMATRQLNVSYSPKSQDVADICSPSPTANQSKGPYPVMIFVHGAGNGDKKDWDTDCRRYATWGFVAVSFNYRNGPWPAQIVDLQAGVRWMRTNATALNIYPNLICGVGDSMGGQLVMWLGYEPQLVNGDLAPLYKGVSSQIQCIVDEFGPSLWGFSHAAGTPSPLPLPLISEYHKWAAPTFIVQGTKDTIVKPENSTALHDALLANHVRTVYDSYPGGHSYWGMTQAQMDTIEMSQINFVINTAKGRGFYPQ